MNPAGRWAYPPEFREMLLSVGLAPQASTPPSLVREALNDQYRLALRRLRDRLRAGQVPKAGYHEAVVALRKQFWPLTLNLQAWERICRPGGT